MLRKLRSKRPLPKWLDNIIQIEIQILLLKKNFQIFLKHIRLYLMIKREKCTINMVWGQMNRNSMKIWVFREIVDLGVLVILVIFGDSNNSKEDSRIFSTILKISSLLVDKKEILIDHKEDKISY